MTGGLGCYICEREEEGAKQEEQEEKGEKGCASYIGSWLDYNPRSFDIDYTLIFPHVSVNRASWLIGFSVIAKKRQKVVVNLLVNVKIEKKYKEKTRRK